MHLQEELERIAALFAPAADIFGDDNDIFAGNSENEPQLASTSMPPAPISALSTPRVSFTFPDILGDGNGSTPRLHSASPSDSPWQPQQQGEPAAAADQSLSVGNGDVVNGRLPAAEVDVDYHSWPIKELRRFLTERGLVRSACGAVADHSKLHLKLQWSLVQSWLSGGASHCMHS